MKKGLSVVLISILVLTLSVFLVACDKDGEAISAYDIAVKNGFTGTEQEWLDSLHGKDGANGLDGKKGRDGVDGKLISIEEVYDSAVQDGYKGSYLQFLQEYLDYNTTYDNTYAVSKAIRSAVVIESNFTVTYTIVDFWGRPIRTEDRPMSAGGAGVIYKMDDNGNAYVITNFHVVFEINSNQPNHVSEDISLYLYGAKREDKKIPATFVGGSAFYDIAVLRVSASEILKDSDAVAAEISSTTVAVGQTAMAIGYPAGEGMSVTSGIVSVDSEQIAVAVDGRTNYPLRVMRVDTAINSGNSGGGLFDSNGNLIGIVNAKYNSTQIENIGYAIPKEIAIGVTENIIANCANDPEMIAVYNCITGIRTATADSRAVYDPETGKTTIKETVVVDSVDEGSRAEGKLRQGDILLALEMNGKKVKIERTFNVADFLLEAKVGDTLTITFIREEEEMTASMTFVDSDVVEYFIAE